MSRILFAASPLVGHVKPMLPVAQRLATDGHQVFFQTSDSFRAEAEAAGLHVLPLLGNANYDHHQLGDLIPELRIASPADQVNISIKHLFADRIVDQYRGLRHVIAEKKIDLVMTDIVFLGMLPLLLSGESRPPVIACGVIAPSWTDPAFSIFTGPDATQQGRVRNIADNERFLSLREPAYAYVEGVLERLEVTVPGGFNVNRLYRLPDVFLQLGTRAFEYPMEDPPPNLIFAGPILHINPAGYRATDYLA